MASALVQEYEDKAIMPLLMLALDCVNEELDKLGLDYCFRGMSPAGQPPIPLLDCATGACGIVWISPMEIFEYDRFPNPPEDPAVRCGRALGVRIEVGVARCAPRGVGREPLKAQDAFEAMRIYMAEAAAIKRALSCCIVPKDRGRQVYVEGWAALPVEGGISGGTWTAVVG